MNEAEIRNSMSKLRDIKMTEEEKKILLGKIISQKKPAFASKPVASEYLHSFALLMRKYGSVFTVCMLLVFTVTGRGITLAAYRALPGDALYKIRVNVIEPVKGNMLSSIPARAEYETGLVMDRLNEAEDLARKGRLGRLVGEQITALISRHISALASTLQPGNSQENDAAVEAIRVNFHKKLNERVRLLEAISTSTPQGVVANDIANIVLKRAGNI